MKNVFLLGTCRVRDIFRNTEIFKDKYNLMNRKNDYVGRTYSLIDTYEMLRCITEKRYDMYNYELRANIKTFRNNILSLSGSIDQVDCFLIEISSLKYFSSKGDIILSPNFGKMDKFEMRFISDEEMDEYYEKLVGLIDKICGKSVKIVFITHLKSHLIKNRGIILENLMKNVKKSQRKDIILTLPSNVLGVDRIDEFLLDYNHYDPKHHDFVAKKFIELFSKMFIKDKINR